MHVCYTLRQVECLCSEPTSSRQWDGYPLGLDLVEVKLLNLHVHIHALYNVIHVYM